MKVNIKDIKVGDRFRKELGEIEELAQSIKTKGLINPITVDEKVSLIAGERRLRACLFLRWEEIDVVVKKGLSDDQKKELEIEENIKRKSFTWQEEILAKLKLHDLKCKIYGKAVKGHKTGGWRLEDTAEALGEAIGSISEQLQLARHLPGSEELAPNDPKFPELFREHSRDTAFRKLKKIQEVAVRRVLAERQREIHGLSNVICGDAIEEMKKLGTGSVDLVLTDPPWGINVEKSAELTTQKKGLVSVMEGEVFRDDAASALALMERAIPEMSRVLKNERHGFLFFGIEHYQSLLELLRKHFDYVDVCPLIWDRGVGGGAAPRYKYRFVNRYEPIFHFWKGQRELNRVSYNVLHYKGVQAEKRIHPTEKPVPLLRWLVQVCTLPGETVLDPFAGSGSAIIAALVSGRHGIAIDNSRQCCDIIANRVVELKDEKLMKEGKR